MLDQLSPHPNNIAAISTVSIQVDGPGGGQYNGIPWHSGTTVLSAMQSSGMKFTAEWYHSFNDWLVISINGTANQGSGAENWSFCVNGQLAKVGIASFRLSAGSNIKWIYTSQYPPTC